MVPVLGILHPGRDRARAAGRDKGCVLRSSELIPESTGQCEVQEPLCLFLAAQAIRNLHQGGE